MEKLNMDYNTIMSLKVYEWENIIETYIEILEERKEAEEEQNNGNTKTNNYSPDKIMKQAQGYLPKAGSLPKIPGMSGMPSIPKF